MLRKGFTLAEVLITISILGIIAAVALPAINANITKSALEKQTQKFYTQAEKAFKLYLVDNDTDSLVGMDFNQDAFAKKYFNIAQKCDDATNCYATLYTYVDNKKKTVAPKNWFTKSTYKIPDGTVISFRHVPAEETADRLMEIVFDVNGKKGPNVIGYDLWSFQVFEDGTVNEKGITPSAKLEKSEADLNKLLNAEFDKCKAGTNSYSGCFGHMLHSKFKFDY